MLIDFVVTSLCAVSVLVGVDVCERLQKSHREKVCKPVCIACSVSAASERMEGEEKLPKY